MDNKQQNQKEQNAQQNQQPPQNEQQQYQQQPPQYQQPMYQQPMYQQPIYQQPMYQQPIMQKKKNIAVGLIAFVVGLLAMILSVVMGPMNAGIAVFIAIPSIVLSIIGIATKRGRAFSVVGLIESVLAIILAFAIVIMFS